MTPTQREIVRAMAECDMALTRAGEKLYLHRNTLLYHQKKIIEKHGLDFRKFYDLIELLKIADEEDRLFEEETNDQRET